MKSQKVAVVVVVNTSVWHFKQTMKSLLEQTCHEVEVLLVDEGADSETLLEMQSLCESEERVSILCNPRQQTVLEATEAGSIMWMDSSARLDEDALSRMLRAMERHNADMVACGVEMQKRMTMREGFEVERERIVQEREEQRFALNYPHCMMLAGKLFRRTALEHMAEGMTSYSALGQCAFLMNVLEANVRLVVVPEVKCVVDESARMVSAPRRERDEYLVRKHFILSADRLGLAVDERMRKLLRRVIRVGGKPLIWCVEDGSRLKFRLWNRLTLWRRNLREAPHKEDLALNSVSTTLSSLTLAYDAKRITHNATGLGNYGRMLIGMLVTECPKNRYLLYTPDKGRDDLRKRCDLLPKVEFCYPELKHNGLGKALWRSFGICHELPAHVDLFHGLSGELPLWLKGTGIPSVVTMHDLIFLRYPEYYKYIDRKIYTYKFRKACQSADRVLAISETTKQDIIRFLHIPEEKIDVVYQGCDASFKQQASSEAKRLVREKYHLPEHFVLSVGSIEQRKNLMLVLRAMTLMKEPVHLVAVGKRTPYVDEIEAFAKTHGLSERVHLYHKVLFSELPVFYQMADVFVYPSRFEGFGIPMIEAANCGVATIGATGSCLEEAGGPDARYVDPDKAEEMAEALTEILGDELLRKRMIERGRAYVRRFEPDVLAQDVMQVYRKAMSSKG